MTDLTRPQEVFNFKDDEFICFLECAQYQPSSTIIFLSKDKRSGDACVILMTHRYTMEKHCGHDINQWSIQKFILTSPSFKRVFSIRNKIKNAHIIELY